MLANAVNPLVSYTHEYWCIESQEISESLKITDFCYSFGIFNFFLLEFQFIASGVLIMRQNDTVEHESGDLIAEFEHF